MKRGKACLCIRSTHEIADQIVELAGHLNAGKYRFFALVAEFDRRRGWACGATQDCAHWLNWALREKLRTARAFEKLPQVSAQWPKCRQRARNHTRQLGEWRQLPAMHERAGIHITAKTAATRLGRGPMDSGQAMDSLMSLRRTFPQKA